MKGCTDDVTTCTYSYFASNAEYKLGAMYCETRSHADLVRPTTKRAQSVQDVDQSNQSPTLKEVLLSVVHQPVFGEVAN